MIGVTHRAALSVLVAAMFCVPGLPAAALNFPVTIDHVYGETTIENAPQRVVSIGLNDQDFLYALGVAPVGVKEWWGSQPFATWPWAEDERLSLGAAPAVLESVEINIEWVAAQQPDLIVAVYSNIDETMYALLSEIAPVVAWPEQYPLWGTPWQEQLRQIARATLGGTGSAETIIAELDAKVAAVAAAHPEFSGRTASMADYRDGQFTLWSNSHAPTRFVTGFRFSFPQQLDALADETGWIYLSPEDAEMMDLDVVIWPNGKQDEIESLSVYRNLDLFKQGRSIFLDASQSDLPSALWFQTPLSIEFMIDRIGPMLAAASDGDPETLVDITG